jgi:hypothetical protein
MSRLFKGFIVFFLGLVLFFQASHNTNAYASIYGSGAYGSGVYGAASTPTPAPGSGSNNNSNSSSNSNNSNSSSNSNNSNSSQTCSSQAPSSAPNLFQINTTNTTALLYFAPAGKPYDSYYVSFGNGKNDEGYGASFGQGQTGGVITYTVFYLKPNFTYTFKVRGGNGCASGAWSKSVSAKTTSSKNSVQKYYPLSFIPYTTTYSIPKFVNNIKSKIPFITKPSQVKVQPATGTKKIIPPTIPQVQAQPAKQSLLDKILGFFGR